MKKLFIGSFLFVVALAGFYFFNQNIANKNELTDTRLAIIDVAEIIATMTVADFVSAVDTSDPVFLNETYGRNNNLMHSAIANKNNPQMVQKLIDVGVDMNHQDADMRTPLHHAIDANNQPAAQILIENGADVTLENEAGLNALRFCEKGLKSLPNHETCTYVVENAGM